MGILCSNIECEPPFGGKEVCELNKEGVCMAPSNAISSEALDSFENLNKMKEGYTGEAVVSCTQIPVNSSRYVKPTSEEKEYRKKVCPKCGVNLKRIIPIKHYFETRYIVRCQNCGFEIDPFESKEEARETWNSL